MASLVLCQQVRAQHTDLVYYQGHFFVSQPISETVKARMEGKSRPENAVVRYEDLRYLTLPYYDFNGDIQRGEMVCHKDIASDLLHIFCDWWTISMPTTRLPWKPTTPPATTTALSREPESYRNTPGEEPSTSIRCRIHGSMANRYIHPLRGHTWTGARISPIKSTKTTCVIGYSKKRDSSGEACGSRRIISTSLSKWKVESGKLTKCRVVS